MGIKTDDENNPSTIFRRFEAVASAFAMLAGMQLDVFTPLKDNPMDSKTLAKALGVRANKLSSLLYALVDADLLKAENGIFSNTSEANRFLVQGNPDYLGRFMGIYSWSWYSILQTAETIRTGIPQARIDWTKMNEEQLLGSFRGSHPDALEVGRQLAKNFDFSGYRNLMDAGGGSGGVSIGLCESYPDLEATIVDLPMAASVSKRFISENNMSDRIKVIATDLIENSPAGAYDVVIVRRLIATLMPEQAKAVLMNIGKTVEKDGIIYIIDQITDDTRLYPTPSAAFFNLLYLNIYDNGQAYTSGDFRNWLTEAGFSDVKIDFDANYPSIITTARKS